MKRMLCLALLVAACSQAGAADVGVGVSVQSDDSWIYVPIDFGSSFRLEPSIRYRDNKTESVSEDQMFGTVLTSTLTSEVSTYELGIGLFGLQQIGESIRAYYGGRLAYLESKQDRTIRTNFGSSTDRTLEKISSDGYRISPTLGVEYLFNKHFSIGAEAEWYYEELDSSFQQLAGVASRADVEATGTDTRLIARFRF